ncbi:hypothetical protein AAG570_004788 [Ranatra chinensis]|uniref:Uncharacterized protein n=1 Tax=Ranatra chinensis TaxID=642074 RepID=A0ABD0Y2M4_9HEMI
MGWLRDEGNCTCGVPETVGHVLLERGKYVDLRGDYVRKVGEKDRVIEHSKDTPDIVVLQPKKTLASFTQTKYLIKEERHLGRPWGHKLCQFPGRIPASTAKRNIQEKVYSSCSELGGPSRFRPIAFFSGELSGSSGMDKAKTVRTNELRARDYKPRTDVTPQADQGAKVSLIREEGSRGGLQSIDDSRFKSFHSKLENHPNHLANALSPNARPLNPPRRLKRRWTPVTFSLSNASAIVDRNGSGNFPPNDEDPLEYTWRNKEARLQDILRLLKLEEELEEGGVGQGPPLPPPRHRPHYRQPFAISPPDPLLYAASQGESVFAVPPSDQRFYHPAPPPGNAHKCPAKKYEARNKLFSTVLRTPPVHYCFPSQDESGLRLQAFYSQRFDLERSAGNIVGLDLPFPLLSTQRVETLRNPKLVEMDPSTWLVNFRPATELMGMLPPNPSMSLEAVPRYCRIQMDRQNNVFKERAPRTEVSDVEEPSSGGLANGVPRVPVGAEPSRGEAALGPPPESTTEQEDPDEEASPQVFKTPLLDFTATKEDIIFVGEHQ